MNEDTDKPEFKLMQSSAQLMPKKNCKFCYGRGSVIRTLPMGNKRMKRKLFRCGCVRKVVVEAVNQKLEAGSKKQERGIKP